MAEEPRVKPGPRLTRPRGGGERKATFSGGFRPAFSLRKDRFMDPRKTESRVFLGSLLGWGKRIRGRQVLGPLEGVRAGFLFGLNGECFQTKNRYQSIQYTN